MLAKSSRRAAAELEVETYFDFSSFANGNLPSPFTGSTWSVSAGKAVNTPTIGAEMLTDPGFENWTTPTNLTSWTESIAGTSTVNREGTQQQAGTFGVRMDVDGSNSAVEVSQTPTHVLNTWIVSSWYAKSGSGAPVLNMRHNNQTPENRIITLGTTYVQYKLTSFIRNLAGASTRFFRTSAASLSMYIDEASTKTLDKATLFTLMDMGSMNGTIKAGPRVTTNGTLAGVVIAADAASDPTNYIMAVINADSAFWLLKCVNGTISQVTVGSAGYVAGASFEVRKNGTTVQVFYNGVQVGTNQTVSDASIINNRYSGLFSTDSGISFDYIYMSQSIDGLVIPIPNGANVNTYADRVSPGDTLSLARNGSYTLGISDQGFSTIKSGTASLRVNIRGNNATINSGFAGFGVNLKSNINVYKLNIRDQTEYCTFPINSSNIDFYDCTFSSNAHPSTFRDVTKNRNGSALNYTRCHIYSSTGLDTCDGFEYWNCDNCICTDCTAEGLHNGPELLNNGHGYECYGESAADANSNIQFVRCHSDDCRVGFSVESPNGNATNTVTLTNCTTGEHSQFDYLCEAPGVMTINGYDGGTTSGNGTINLA